MLRLLARVVLSLVVIQNLNFLVAAPLAIGVATVNGTFQIDNSPVEGDATLFDGTLVQTKDGSSRFQLSAGTRVELAPASRVRVFGDRLVLEKGTTEVAHSAGYQIEALGLHITPTDPASIARVRLQSDRQISVAAMNGPVKVYDGNGTLVASMNAGTSVALQGGGEAPQSGTFEMGGCLLNEGGRLILASRNASKIVEITHVALKGQSDIRKEVGSQIHISGNPVADGHPVPGASQLIRVDNLTQTAAGGCQSTANLIPGASVNPAGISASTLSAAGPGAVTSGAGLSTGAVVALGAAAAGGTAAGIAVATRGNTSP